MKKNKLLVLSLSLLMVLGGAVSCGGSSATETPTETPTVTPTEAPATEAVDETDHPFAKKEYSELVDYTSQLKFDSSSGRKYVEITSVKSLVDGDTSHFYISDADAKTFPSSVEDTYNEGVLKVRYLGIDTPESTGAIEEWGKTASKFNKERLSQAESIIVESNDENWNIDSTGTRVLGFVWYRLSGETEYRNINLEIMEAGLAYAKTLNSLCYSEIFQKAFNQANEHELCVFSKAASMYTFTDSVVKESKGWVLGSTKTNTKIISFDSNEVDNINAVKVYKSNTKGTDTVLASVTDISAGLEKDTTYYLGMEVGGKKVYFDGSIADGYAYTVDSMEKAAQVHIEKNASKSGYYSMYLLDEDETHHYITINSANNIDFMYRDKNFYYGSYQEVTIRGLWENKESFNGVLVRFEGICVKVTGTTLYMQEYDEETGLYYGMQVFLGYSCPALELLKVGNEVSVCTNFQYSDQVSCWQCAGLEYMMMKPNYEKNTRVISTGNEVVFREVTGEILSNTTADENLGGLSLAETYVGTAVKATDLKVERAYTTESTTSSNGAMTLTCTDANGDTIKVRTEVLYNEDGSTVTQDQLVGKTISVNGIVDAYNDSYQVRVFTWSDITFSE